MKITPEMVKRGAAALHLHYGVSAKAVTQGDLDLTEHILVRALLGAEPKDQVEVRRVLANWNLPMGYATKLEQALRDIQEAPIGWVNDEVCECGECREMKNIADQALAADKGDAR